MGKAEIDNPKKLRLNVKVLSPLAELLPRFKEICNNHVFQLYLRRAYRLLKPT